MNYDKLSKNEENSGAVENEWTKAFETPEDSVNENEKVADNTEEQTENASEVHEQQERHPLADVESRLAMDVYQKTHPGFSSNENWRKDFSNWQNSEWGVGLEGYDTLTDEEKADFAMFVHDEMVNDWREEQAQSQAEADEINSAVGQGVQEIWQAQARAGLAEDDSRSGAAQRAMISDALRENGGDAQGIKDETERQLGEIQGVVAEGEQADRAYDAVGRAQVAITEAQRKAGLIDGKAESRQQVSAELKDFVANQPEGLSEEEFNNMLDNYVAQKVGEAEAYKQQQEADAAAKREIDSAVNDGSLDIWRAQVQNDLIAHDGRSQVNARRNISESLRANGGDVQGIKEETERQLGEIQGVVAEGERADRAYDAVNKAQTQIFEARRDAGLIEENGKSLNEIGSELGSFLANQPEGLSEEEFNSMLDNYVAQQVGDAQAYKQQQAAAAAEKQAIDSAVRDGSLDIWQAQAQNDLIAHDGRSRVRAMNNISESLRENGGDVQGIKEETERQLGEIQGVVAEGERADRAYDAVNKAQTQIFEARRDAGLIEENGRTLNEIGSELGDFLANQPEGLSEEEFNAMLDNYVAQKVGEANAYKQQQEAAAAEKQAIDSAVRDGSLDIWRAQAQGGLAGDDSRSRIRDMNRISESLRENGGDAQGIRDEAERQLGEVQGVIAEGEQADRAYDAVNRAQTEIFQAQRRAGMVEDNGRALNGVGSELKDFLANQPEGLSEEEFNAMLDNYVAQKVSEAEAVSQQKQDDELIKEAINAGVGRIAMAESHAGVGSRNGREFQQHSRELSNALRSVERPEGMSAEEYAKKISEEATRMADNLSRGQQSA